MTIIKDLARVLLFLNSIVFLLVCFFVFAFLGSVASGSYRSDYSQLALIASALGGLYVGGLVHWRIKKQSKSYKSRLLLQLAILLIVPIGLMFLMIAAI